VSVSKVRNISGGQVDVPVLGRTVEDGEIVDLPDFQADGTSPLTHPTNRWEPVAEPKAAKATAADASAKGM
jgi:hypothetical protein